jgi:hypothetical protein
VAARAGFERLNHVEPEEPEEPEEWAGRDGPDVINDLIDSCAGLFVFQGRFFVSLVSAFFDFGSMLAEVP